MQLLRYTHRGLSAVMFILMAIWGILFYFAIIDEVMDETDDALENSREMLVRKALEHPGMLKHNRCPMHAYSFRPLTDEEALHYRNRLFDSVQYVEMENEYEPVRIMRSCFQAADGRFYELELKQSTLERDDMVEAILAYLAVLFVLLWLCTIVSTRLVLKRIFRPLSCLLAWLDRLMPGHPAPPLHNDTPVLEFRRLNEAALAMSRRSEQAYQEQKQFIENAAHELQTPLALIRGRLELLADSEELSERQLQCIDEIFGSLNRVVQLNKSLLLLSRISNRQFPDRTDVNANMLLRESANMLLDIYDSRHIRLEWAESGTCTLSMDESLARTMLDNLVKNAIVHSPHGGRLAISVTPHSITLRNTGSAPLDGEAIFRRFVHASTAYPESTGLGLAIVKSIADLYGISVTYSFCGEHVFTLSLNRPSC